MSNSPQIQARINTIAGDLAAGKTRQYILGTYGKKWGCSRTSLDRYIADAKKIAENILAKADKKIQEQASDVIADAIIGGLRSALEVDKAVQDIIFQNAQMIRLPDVTGPEGQILQKGRVVKVDNTVRDKIAAAGLYYRRHNLLGKDNDLSKQKVKITINGKPRPVLNPPSNDPAGT